ncbi:MAG TPA: hypothetical protein VHF05_03645 [Candidatus Paceibacterota bacterium]|nr:hypothetical protein [Candidatus Paceibacterota bacterium]
MAILGDKKYGAAEINFVDYNYGYVSYSLRLLYSGKSLINPELLAEDPFHFDEYENDYLIPFFENLLQEDNESVFKSLEPEVRIDAHFNPKLGLEDALKIEGAWYSDKYKGKLQKVDDDRQKSGGKLQDDGFVFCFYINEHKLRPWREQKSAYGDFVPAMLIGVSRQELEDFLNQLKKDYKEWKVRNKEQIEYYGREKSEAKQPEDGN